MTLLRHLFALIAAVLGTGGVLAIVLAMNSPVPPRVKSTESNPVAMEVTRKAPKRAPVPKASPQPVQARTQKTSPPPATVGGAALAGVDLSLGGLDLGVGPTRVADLAVQTDTKKLVMTESSVDTPPRPLSRTSPRYPPRARADSVEGHVVLSLLVDVSGNVEKAKVVESQPPGVFDEAALEAVRQWRFEPATYEGAPVKAWARQRMPFVLL